MTSDNNIRARRITVTVNGESYEMLRLTFPNGEEHDTDHMTADAVARHLGMDLVRR